MGYKTQVYRELRGTDTEARIMHRRAQGEAWLEDRAFSVWPRQGYTRRMLEVRWQALTMAKHWSRRHVLTIFQTTSYHKIDH